MVGFVRFAFSRTLGKEKTLAAMSCTKDDLLSSVEGKTVALVGNSRALAQTRFGSQIDHSDIVMRINRAPMPSAISHGSRTHCLH